MYGCFCPRTEAPPRCVVGYALLVNGVSAMAVVNECM